MGWVGRWNRRRLDVLFVSSAVRWLNGDIWGLGCGTGQKRACWFFLWVSSSTTSTWKREEKGRGHRSRRKKSNVLVLAVLSRKRTRWKRSKRTTTHQSSCRCTGELPTRHPPPHPRDDAFCHLCPSPSSPASPCHPAHFLLHHWPSHHNFVHRFHLCHWQTWLSQPRACGHRLSDNKVHAACVIQWTASLSCLCGLAYLGASWPWVKAVTLFVLTSNASRTLQTDWKWQWWDVANRLEETAVRHCKQVGRDYGETLQTV